MEQMDEKCLNALSEYCIYLIKERRFCDARKIGNAIEDVLNTQHIEQAIEKTSC